MSFDAFTKQSERMRFFLLNQTDQASARRLGVSEEIYALAKQYGVISDICLFTPNDAELEDPTPRALRPLGHVSTQLLLCELIRRAQEKLGEEPHPLIAALLMCRPG